MIGLISVGADVKDGPTGLVISKLFQFLLTFLLVYTHPVKYLNIQQMDWPKICADIHSCHMYFNDFGDASTFLPASARG